MKNILSVCLFTFSLLLTASVEAKSWVIKITNSTNIMMEFTVSYETKQGKQYTFKHKPSIAPQEYYQFQTSRGVRLKNNKAKIEVKGEQNGFGLTGGHVEKKWGNLDKNKYLNAAIKEINNDVNISMSLSSSK